MRVLVVSQYYDPEPVPLPAAVAQGLLRRGHDVRVLTGLPNYPDGHLRRGYSRIGGRATIDDVPALRVPMVIAHSQNPFTRALNYLSFGLSSRLRRHWVRGADVVYVYAPQLTAALGPYAWSRRMGVPFVLHVQDVWPDSILGSGMVNGRLSSLLGATLDPWIRSVYREAGAILATAPSMARLLIERGAPEHAVSCVLNWSTGEPVLPAPHESDEGTTTVMFAGNLGVMQDLETTIRAAASMRSVPRFVVEIVGSGTEEPRLRAIAAELQASNVRFSGRVGADGMQAAYGRSDFQLVTLKDLPVFMGTIPSKFPASLARGIPVISSVPGDVSAMVERARCGIVAVPGDVGAMREALLQAAESTPVERAQWAAAALQLYESEMSSEAGIDAIERTLTRCVRRQSDKETQS